MIKPKIAEILQSKETKAVIRLVFDEDYFYFKGHFPVQPLIPGVVQLGLACDYATSLFKGIGAFKKAQSLKFIAPILPTDEVELELLKEQTPGRVSFTYRIIREGVSSDASRGRLQFAEDIV